MSAVGVNELQAAAQRARQGGEGLRALGVAQRATQLETLGRAWAEPSSRWHRAALSLAQGLGVSTAMLSWGLREGCGRWRSRAFLSALRRELPSLACLEAGWGPRALAPRLCGLVLASTVPPAGLLAPALPLLLGAPVLLRPAAGLAALLELFVDSMRCLVPTLAQAVELVAFSSADAELTRCMSSLVDVMVVHGSDEAVGSWRRVSRPEQRLVAFGHRLSAAIIDAEGCAPGELERALAGLARDVLLWDQAGCLSPRCVFVHVRAERREALLQRLLSELSKHERRWPALSGCAHDAAAVSNARRALSLEGELLQTAGGAALLAFEEEGVFEPGPGARTLMLRPYSPGARWETLFSSVAGHLQALGVAGVSERESLLARLAPLGLNRICRLGELQRPPLTWRHDGVGHFAPLLRWVDVER